MLSKGLFRCTVSLLGEGQLCLHLREMLVGESVWIPKLLRGNYHPLPRIEGLFDQLNGGVLYEFHL
jgi:hypothetical protein